MKNRSGFTLIELLAVIVILAIVIAVAVPSTMSISNRIKENLFCSKIDFIENAAKLYGEDRRDSFTSRYTINGTSYYGKKVQVKELVTTNYLKKDNSTSPYIEDPRDKNASLDNLYITIYIKNDRIYVDFDNTIDQTCEK